MIWVKLCGLRSPSDVAAAERWGANAIGLVIAERSPRRITLDHAHDLAASTDLERFLVTEDLDPSTVVEAALEVGASGVQPHGAWALETAIAARQAGLDVLLPVTVTAPVSDTGIPSDVIPLFDAAAPGGGIAFDHAFVAGVDRPFVLAGGLNPDNVAGVIERLRPYGVDVSSGIERTPGIKDEALIRRFMEAVR